MKHEFDDFLAGRGLLAAVLRELPAFEPPATMAAQFAQQARMAEAERAALVFEAPATLQAGFLAEAARLQAAQQPRHDALVAALHAGQSARAVLGHDVSAATTQWLETRPQRVAAAAARRPAPSRWSLWAPRFALAGVSVLALGVGLQAWRTPPAESFMALPAPAEAVGQSASNAPLAGQASPNAIALQAAPIVAAAPLTKAPGSAPGDTADALAQLRGYEAARRHRYTGTAEDAETPPEAEATLPAERAQAMAPAPATAMVAAPAAALAQTRSAEAPPSPAPVAAKALAASPAPRMAAPAAPAPAPAARGPGAAALHLQLDNSPQLAARRWQLLGHGRAPRILSATPEAEAVRDWVEAFRLALPAAQRPATLAAQPDPALPPEALRLELPPG